MGVSGDNSGVRDRKPEEERRGTFRVVNAHLDRRSEGAQDGRTNGAEKKMIQVHTCTTSKRIDLESRGWSELVRF